MSTPVRAGACLAALLLAVAVLMPRDADAGRNKTEPYIDMHERFSFVPPRKWDAIPIPEDYKFMGISRSKAALRTIVKFKDRIPDRERHVISLEVLRIIDAKDLDDAVARYKAFKKKNDVVWDVLVEETVPIGKRDVVRLDVHRSSNWAESVFIFFHDSGAFAMEGTCGRKAYEKNYKKDFLHAALSFHFLTDKEHAKLATRFGWSPDDESLPPGWDSIDTEFYHITFNTEREFAVEMGHHLEAIVGVYRRDFPMPEAFSKVVASGAEGGDLNEECRWTRFKVKIFNKNAQFQSYAASNGVTGAAAYYSPMQQELVCYKTTGSGKKKTFHIMYHEASHQYLHHYIGFRADIPSWLDEGLGDYYYGGKFKKNGSFEIGENMDRIATIKAAIRTNKHVPIKKIIDYKQSDYYANAQLCYSQGWAMVYFFYGSKDPKYNNLAKNFIASIRETKKREKANEACFGTLDLDQLEEDWKEFILDL